jgi:hypothetical protein
MLRTHYLHVNSPNFGQISPKKQLKNRIWRENQKERSKKKTKKTLRWMGSLAVVVVVRSAGAACGGTVVVSNVKNKDNIIWNIYSCTYIIEN